jgi:hypothetical protein
MGFDSYKSYLASDLWKSIKKKALSENKKKCSRCGERKAKLQVHHRSYDLRTMVGSDTRSLSVVCSACHVLAEQPKKRQHPIDRLYNANETVLTPYVPTLLERCQRWYEKNKRWERRIGSPEEARALIEMYRLRATAKDGPRCLVCGRQGYNPTLPPKVLVESGYFFCGNHLWGQIRAAISALRVDLTRD